MPNATADWRDVAFHTGKSHRGVAEQCKTCHEVHSARVDASDCVACHERVRSSPKSRLRPPLPFDTTKALRQTSSREPPQGLIVPGRARGQGSAPPEDDPPESRSAVSASPSDTFPHARHSRLACLTCHDLRSKARSADVRAAPRLSDLPSPASRAGQLQGLPPAGRARHAPSRAGGGYRASARPSAPYRPVPPREARQPVLYGLPRHAGHARARGLGRTCAGCHTEHHAESRDCAACHRTAAITAPHRMPIQAHTGCNACHTPATVARLVPTRSFCLVCHQPQQDHYQPKECSACHFQRTPAELQPRLTRAGGPS